MPEEMSDVGAPQGLSWSWELDFDVLLAAMADAAPPAASPSGASPSGAGPGRGGPGRGGPPGDDSSCADSPRGASSVASSPGDAAGPAAGAAAAAAREAGRDDADAERDDLEGPEVPDDAGPRLPATALAGRVAERLAPGPDLTAWLAMAPAAALDDGDLAAVAGSWRRVASWAQARELAAVAQIASRAAARDKDIGTGPDGRPARVPVSAAAEVALELTMSQYGASWWTDLAVTLGWRLAATGAALDAGELDLPRARLIAEATGTLSDEAARAVEERVLPAAGGQTTGMLRAALRRAVIAADPRGAEERRKESERRAKVVLYPDEENTATLAGQRLPTVHAAAAMARIKAMARALKASGAGGGIDLLCAQVYVGLLLGTLPLIPPAQGAPPDDPAGPPGADPPGQPTSPGPPDPPGADPPSPANPPAPPGPPGDVPGQGLPRGPGQCPPRGSGSPGAGPAEHAGDNPDDHDPGVPRAPDADPGEPPGGPGQPGADPGERPRTPPANDVPPPGQAPSPVDNVPPPGDADAPNDEDDYPGPDDGPAPGGWDAAGQGAGDDGRPAAEWPSLPGVIPPAFARPSDRADGDRPSGARPGLLDVSLPWQVLAGISAGPGYLSRIGPVTATQARRLAECAADDPNAEWRIIVTTPGGMALAVTRIPRSRSRDGPQALGTGISAAAGTGLVSRVTLTITEDLATDPPPLDRPGTGPDPPGSILAVAVQAAARAATRARAAAAADAAAGGCAHASASPGYRPPPRLQDYITARDLTCRFPRCRQPAWRGDLDHTIPFDDGGLTCRCNLGGLCRTHHLLKHHPDWKLTQLAPGAFTWTTPSGRTFTATPDIHAQ
jgi:hypothetical protein